MLAQLTSLWRRHDSSPKAAMRRQAARRPFARWSEQHDALARCLPPSWDERGYLTAHPDVAEDVLAGNLASGYAHWLRWGYAEGRSLSPWASGLATPTLPRAALAPYWHEVAYLGRYPHVATLIGLGLYQDGLGHCWAVRDQQRLDPPPTPRWDEAAYLWLHSDVAEAVEAGVLASGFAHWFHYGLGEGRAAPPTDKGGSAWGGAAKAPTSAAAPPSLGAPQPPPGPGPAPSHAVACFAALAEKMRAAGPA